MKKNKLYRLIATVFGAGNSPLAPGTFGSLAGLVLCLLLHKFVVIYVITFLILFFIGVRASEVIEKEEGIKDPSLIVIDEFVCIFPAFFLIPVTPVFIIVGFILYRIIDILKVPPMNKLEDIGKGWGIMFDDLMGGIYTNIILQVLVRIF